jgi:hypothetical protein
VSWDTDSQYLEHRLTRVIAGDTDDGGGWTLAMGGSCLWCPSDECSVAPVVGETMRLYGKGFGHSVRGIIIEGRVYKYLTEEQEEEQHAAWLAEEQGKRALKAEAERASRDERRAALPGAFRERLSVFESRNPDWRRDFEGYELFVCEEATRLVEHFGADVEALRAFSGKSPSEQAAAVPALRLSEHSGNTWGAAVGLAMRLMVDPKLVRGAHGALCPLVGCVAYGCPGAGIERKGEP